MKTQKVLSMTQKATQALENAVAKAVEEHRQRGIPMAIWRGGKAISISASEFGSSTEASATKSTSNP